MNTPHLVQRGRFKPDVTKSNITGIDSILNFEYMGSSEFEFGAMPEALRELLPKLDQYDMQAASVGPHKVWVLGRKDDLPELVTKILPGVYANEYRLKESSRMASSLNEPNDGFHTEFWWDLCNHWIAVVSKPQAKKVLFALSQLRDRWVKEGKIT